MTDAKLPQGSQVCRLDDNSPPRADAGTWSVRDRHRSRDRSRLCWTGRFSVEYRRMFRESLPGNAASNIPATLAAATAWTIARPS